MAERKRNKAFVLLIGGAYVLYNQLRGQMAMPQLATQGNQGQAAENSIAMVTGKLLLDCREVLCAFNTMGEY